jgi:hypothetical protein
MKKLIPVVFLFSLSAPLLAQQAETGINGLQFLAPMQLAIGRDNNFLVDRTSAQEKLFVLSLSPSVQTGAPDIRPQTLADSVFLARLPKIAYVNDSRRHEFMATWLPEFEVFASNGDQNAFNQQATANFNYYITRNVQVWFGDRFETSKDPARTMSNVFVLLPRGDYTENSFTGAVEFQPSRVTNVAIAYDTAYTKFGQPDPFQTHLLNSWSSGYSVSLTRLLGRTQRISARYSLYTVRRINRAAKFDDTVDTHLPFERPMHSLTLQYRVRPNPSTSLGFSGGTIKSDLGVDYTFSGSINRRLGNFWAGGTYIRGLALQARSDAGFIQGPDNNSFYDLAIVRFKGQPTRYTGLLVETAISRAVSKSLVDSRKSLLARVRYDYRVTDRNVLFASWESFHQSHNVFVQSPLSRNRIMVGIEISLASELERRVSNRNEDAQYVALTDHAIRRRSLEDN